MSGLTFSIVPKPANLKRSKKTQPLSQPFWPPASALPGESASNCGPAGFVPLSSSNWRNLTPPQYLNDSGQIVSSRTHEVKTGFIPTPHISPAGHKHLQHQLATALYIQGFLLQIISTPDTTAIPPNLQSLVAQPWQLSLTKYQDLNITPPYLADWFAQSQLEPAAIAE